MKDLERDVDISEMVGYKRGYKNGYFEGYRAAMKILEEIDHLNTNRIVIECKNNKECPVKKFKN